MLENIKFRKGSVVLFLMALFLFLWASNIYFSVKNAKIADIVTIKIQGLSEDELRKVKAYRVTPRSDSLQKIPGTGDIRVYDKYFKKIRLSFSGIDIDMVKEVKIEIGRKWFSFTGEEMLNQWKKIETTLDCIMFEAPGNVRGENFSKVQQFENIINWPGDLVVIGESLNYVVLFLVLSLIAWVSFPLSFKNKLSNNSMIRIIVPALSIAVVLSASVYLLYRNGFFTWEMNLYLPHYLGDRTIFQKVFNCLKADSYYRGRELSYLFNYLDAQFIFYSIKSGFPHFLSGIYYFLLSLIAFFHLYFSKRYLLKSMYWVSVILLMVYLVSPTPFLSGTYFRTSKIIVSLGLLLSLWILYAKLKINTDKVSVLKPYLQFAKYFLIALFIAGIMSLVDETGIVFVALLTIFLIVNYMFYRKKIALPLISGYSLALIFAFFYRSILGPWLVFKAAGVHPELWTLTGFFPVNIQNLDNSFLLFLQYIGLLFGNVGGLFAIFIFFFIFCIFRSFNNHAGFARDCVKDNSKVMWFIKRAVAADGTFIAGSLALITIIYLMTLRHPPLFRPELKLLNYALPFVTLFLFITNLALHRLLILKPDGFRYLTFILWLILILNIHSIGIHNHTLIDAGREDYRKSIKVIKAISSPDISPGQLEPSFEKAVRAIRQKSRKGIK